MQVSDSPGTLSHEVSQRAENPDPPVWLKPSRSPFRKPTVFFTRNVTALNAGRHKKSRGLTKMSSNELGLSRPLFKVTSPTCEYYALRLPLLKAGFKRVGDISLPIDCNVLWGKSLPMTPSTKLECRPWHRLQKINHFPGSHLTFGCKTGLMSTLHNAVHRTGDHSLLGMTPITWRLPQETKQFKQAMEELGNRGKRYIAKPSRGSCGRGIRLFTPREKELVTALIEGSPVALGAGTAAGASVPDSTSTGCSRSASPSTRQTSGERAQPSSWYVVQEYIENPMLLRENQRKFDFRLYVAVTSFQPLVCYLHRDGLTRFAAEKYDSSVGDPQAMNRFAHLTNYSVGRRLEVPSEPGAEGPRMDLQLKDSYRSVLEQIRQERGDSFADKVEADIHDVIVRTLMAGAPTIRRLQGSPYSTAFERVSNSFEVFGFDIMLDDSGRPWLIEINTLPSFESCSTLDYNVKSNMATDLLNLAMIELFERSESAFAASGLSFPSPPTAPSASKENQNSSQSLSCAYSHSLDGVRHKDDRLGAVDAQIEDTVARLQDEGDYCGRFQRLYPHPATMEQYRHLEDMAVPLISVPLQQLKH